MNEEMVDKLWGVSPANWLGYGLAIVVLALAVWFLSKELIREKKLNQTYMDHLNSILIKIQTRLEDQQYIVENQNKILNECEKINTKLDAKNS